MSIKFTKRPVGDVTVFDIAGRLTLGEGTSTLRDEIRHEVKHTRAAKILLNLGEVSCIDASGIGELVSGQMAVENNGGALKLLNPTGRVADLLQVTKLYSDFDVHRDEGAAVRSFGPARPQMAQEGYTCKKFPYE